jgi:hypothetical protein
MCIMCNPAFADAFRSYTFPSRRQILKSAAAATAGAFICDVVPSAPALAQEGSLQDVASQFDRKTLPRVTIFRAKEIITLDPDRPSATAVAVLGDRILAVGSVDDLKAAAGGQPYVIDDTFADKVITPGLIAQHDHPLLTGLTMVSEIIAIEDWVLPSGVVPAANSPSEYRKRLADANAKLKIRLSCW